ncbi:hypothetical protein ACJJBL_002062 [Enterobacter hormaechei]|uniref:hypothetical protein n=1 Tax=Enterobacter hormaechei TaxID=158836 RepID=UPI0006AC9524|nr:hypothetical protein [Enterobacter hormaechei]AXO40994.1 hypothetical protein AXA51_13690 [Enterobacter hormaechei]ELN4164210.1 hypothetical protein [Enterobacter hormaechei]KUQ29831.1 hypothetical protein AWI13_15240 [Enterobacter hormaechei subsp. xiangfangensis]
MITEKNNVFYCDCGFSFQRGRSGAHDCADGLRNKLAESEARYAALAAENAGLKNFIISDCHVAHIEPETFYEEEVTRYVSADGYEPETPATDAFLAEVRARGVAMFASKCKEESKRASSSDARDSWWVSAENADEFASQLRKGVQS